MITIEEIRNMSEEELAAKNAELGKQLVKLVMKRVVIGLVITATIRFIGRRMNAS